MQHHMRIIALSAVIALLLIAGVVQAQGPDGIDTPEDWQVIYPGGDTMCSDGSPYYFLARPGDPDKVMVNFQGGGACWNSFTCGVQQSFFADLEQGYMASSEALGMTPLAAHPPAMAEYGFGIFAMNNPDNPFKDYTIVYIPYCTADLHTGSHDGVYEAPGGERIVIHHQGVANVTAALDWLFAEVLAPETVFINGCSAGGPAAVFHAPTLITHYPAARSVVFVDSAGGYTGNLSGLVNAWGLLDNLAEDVSDDGMLTTDSFDLPTFFNATGEAFPDVQFGQFNGTTEGVQPRFLRYMGQLAASYPDTLYANLDALTAPNQITYTAESDIHCLTPRDDFYTLSVDGVPFLEWYTALVNGAPLEDVGY